MGETSCKENVYVVNIKNTVKLNVVELLKTKMYTSVLILTDIFPYPAKKRKVYI